MFFLGSSLEPQGTLGGRLLDDDGPHAFGHCWPHLGADPIPGVVLDLHALAGCWNGLRQLGERTWKWAKNLSHFDEFWQMGLPKWNPESI